MAKQPRTFPLATVLTAVVLAALTLASCGGSSSPTASPSGAPAQAPPEGYQWVGLARDHIWLAVPDSWVALNLNSISVTQAMARLKLTGQTAYAMRKGVEQIHAAGGLIVVDTASVASSPSSFATNVNAFCLPSGITPGPSAASQIVSETESSYPNAGAQVISDRKVISTTSLVIVKIESILQTKAGLTEHQVQFVTLTRRGQLCYTSFSTDRPAEFYPQFRKMAGTFHIG